MMGSLALITGATSGIGKAIAELFADKRVALILSGRNQQALADLQQHLSEKVSVEIVQADLSHLEGRKRLIKTIQIRTPDIVINSAGFGLYGPALNYSIDQQLEILEVNGRVVLEITLEAGRLLVSAKKKGVILNISSASAFQVMPNMSVYAASKAFVNHFSQGLDFEFRKNGVRVLTLCPGMVRTDFQNRAGGKVKSEHIGILSTSFVAEQVWKQIEELNPLLIIDWKYRFLTYFSKILPTTWIAKAVEREIAKRILKHEKEN